MFDDFLDFASHPYAQDTAIKDLRDFLLYIMLETPKSNRMQDTFTELLRWGITVASEFSEELARQCFGRRTCQGCGIAKENGFMEIFCKDCRSALW